MDRTSIHSSCLDAHTQSAVAFALQAGDKGAFHRVGEHKHLQETVGLAGLSSNYVIWLWPIDGFSTGMPSQAVVLRKENSRVIVC